MPLPITSIMQGHKFANMNTHTKNDHREVWSSQATIKKTVLLHYNKVVFTHRIKLHSSNKTKISGKYEYQICKDACEQPPYETFDFELQGTPECK